VKIRKGPYGTRTTLNGKIKYEFSGKVWQHASPGGWYFISLPKAMSKEIRSILQENEEGWGRLKALAVIGNSQWKTAIWFDSKNQTYLLPLKIEIRKKETISLAQQIEVGLWL
jgi:hypothetical protein